MYGVTLRVARGPGVDMPDSGSLDAYLSHVFMGAKPGGADERPGCRNNDF